MAEKVQYLVDKTSEDAEVDCMGCIIQIFDRFKNELHDKDKLRIATWLKERYEGKITK